MRGTFGLCVGEPTNTQTSVSFAKAVLHIGLRRWWGVAGRIWRGVWLLVGRCENSESDGEQVDCPSGRTAKACGGSLQQGL